MLTRGTIQSLINCQLPADTIRQILTDLTFDRIDLDVFRGFIDSIREANQFSDSSSVHVLDCSGTGGSCMPHFNTSTTAAFVLAAGGVKVAKFGNRAAKSLSGSFDLLEALGIPINIPSAAVDQILNDTGLIFLFAPQYYPSLARLSQIRRSLPGPSIFNAIGPLLHPLNPARRLMGTSDPNIFKLVGQYLSLDPGTERAIVVRAESGLDEFDPCARNQYAEISKNQLPARKRLTGQEAEAVLYKSLEPINATSAPALSITPQNSHDIFHSLLQGTAHPYFKSLVCLNAGAGFKVWGATESIEDGSDLAGQLLDSGEVASQIRPMQEGICRIH